MAKKIVANKVTRVMETVELITNGVTTSEIRKYADKHGWCVASRTIDMYISQAKDIIAQENRESRAFRRNLADRRMNMIFSRSMAARDYRTALAAQAEYNKVFGLYGNDQKESGGQEQRENPAEALTTEELKALAGQIMAESNSEC